MQSRLTVQTVVIILGVVAITSLVGAIVLIAVNKAVPSELWAFGTGALGAVAGILAKTDSAPPVAAPTSLASVHSDVPIEAAPNVG